MRGETPRWIGERIDALNELIHEHDFKGFDPFDLPNSPLLGWIRPTWRIPQLLLSKFGSRLAPHWLRVLLRVPSIEDPKIYSCAYFAYRFLGDSYRPDAKEMLLRLVALARKHTDGVYWGYDYTWATMCDGTNRRGSSTLVPSSFAMFALAHEIIAFDNNQYRSTLAQALNYYRRHHQCRNTSGTFLGYFTHSRVNTHNANLLGCAALSCGATILRDKELLEVAAEAAATSLAAIQKTGFIPYNDHPRGSWTDCFHHVYVIASLMVIQQQNPLVDRHVYQDALDRLNVYFRNAFLRNDELICYYPGRLDPIDPHNFAVTALFMVLNGDDERFGTSALKLLQRLDEIAWNIRGQRYHFQIRNHTPDDRMFLRWTQVWMFLALSAVASAENVQHQLTAYRGVHS